MPRDNFGDNLTWFLHGRKVVEGEGEVNLANATLVVADPATGVVLQVRDAGTGSVVPLVTNSRGETPDTWYAPLEQVTISAGGGTYHSETIELRSLYQRVLAAEAAATSAAVAAQTISSSLSTVVAESQAAATAAEQAAVAAADSAQAAEAAAANANTFPVITSLAEASGYPARSVVVARKPPT